MVTAYKQGQLTLSKSKLSQAGTIGTIIDALVTNRSVAKYQQIMADLKTVDVSTDRNFQKLFNGFYRMRQRKPEYYQDYFSYLEEHKKGVLNYSDAVNHFYDKFHRVEASFASKLVATIDPTQPIIDKNILSFCKIRLPYSYETTRMETIIKFHSELQQKMLEYCDSSEGKTAINLFDTKFPDNTITPIKKIDFIIWQIQK